MDDQWLTHIRSVLLTRAPALALLIARVPLPPDQPDYPAIYTAHLSTIDKPAMPCVTLRATWNTGAAPHLLSARGVLLVEVWTPDTGTVAGQKGARRIYDEQIKPVLQMSHRHEKPPHDNPCTTAAWLVKWMTQIGRDDTGWDPDYHATHLVARYDVILRERGNDARYGIA